MHYQWVESFTREDITQILQILNHVSMNEGTNGYSEPLSFDEGEEIFSEIATLIRKGYASQLLVRDETTQEIVGLVTLERHKYPARAHVVEIKKCAIHPRRRGQFLKEAWKVVLDRCTAMGSDLMQIDVSEDGPVKLWEKLGFTCYMKVQDYARVGSRKLDGYYLGLYVNDAYALLKSR